ncbi:hypothetical protein, partial [Mycobacterium tuberculosis]
MNFPLSSVLTPFKPFRLSSSGVGVIYSPVSCLAITLGEWRVAMKPRQSEPLDLYVVFFELLYFGYTGTYIAELYYLYVSRYFVFGRMFLVKL